MAARPTSKNSTIRLRSCNSYLRARASRLVRVQHACTAHAARAARMEAGAKARAQLTIMRMEAPTLSPEDGAALERVCLDAPRAAPQLSTDSEPPEKLTARSLRNTHIKKHPHDMAPAI